MDGWKYYAITHREHEICNPTTQGKLSEVIDLLRLDAGDSIVDFGCGKGWFLTKLARQYRATGIGIDISPFFIDEARQRHREKARDADVQFIEMDGAAFKPEALNTFALASCLGASFIFGGYRETLSALAQLVKPGGWLVCGEPYWRRDPAPDYLAAIHCDRTLFGTHVENVKAGEAAGLHLLYIVVSNPDDFDRYEGLQWYAMETYRTVHADDPDVPELVDRVTKERDAYLEWGRETLGWAIYMFRAPTN